MAEEEKLAELAQVLLERTKDGKLNWSPWSTVDNSYSAPLGDMSVRVSRFDQTSVDFHLLNVHGGNLAQAHVSCDSPSYDPLYEVYRLVSGVEETLDKALAYLREMPAAAP